MIPFTHKILKNFKKNEKFALLMIYTQPKSAKVFKLLSILLIPFSASMFIEATTVFYFAQIYVLIIPSCIVLFSGFLYFCKVLGDITKEREAEIRIEKGKVLLR